MNGFGPHVGSLMTTPRERLLKALDEAEAAATPENKTARLQLDQIAWLIGSLPSHIDKGEFTNNRPKLAALIAEMQPASIFEAKLRWAEFRDEESPTGQVAELLIKTYE
jgi:hypothetical protein